MDEIDTDTRTFLKETIASFSPGIRYACAYGSGVFKQSGHKSIKDNMIDFIFVVNDSFTWHQQNLCRHPHHYSFFKYFSPHTISKIQTDFGASVYFNTRIDLNGRLIKYGVIEQRDFVDDMLKWETLYISGRLHKPVVTLKGLDNPTIYNAIESNLNAAFETSLLILPEQFTEEELFVTIAGLSYTGDFRMIVGEDKNKVINIVKPNITRFQHLYKDILERNQHIFQREKMFEQDKSHSVLVKYLKGLPANLLKLSFNDRRISPNRDVNAVIEDVARDHVKCKTVVFKGINKIVKRSSISQSAKGVLTAGFNKTIAYSGAKLVKMIRGLVK